MMKEDFEIAKLIVLMKAKIGESVFIVILLMLMLK